MTYCYYCNSIDFEWCSEDVPECVRINECQDWKAVEREWEREADVRGYSREHKHNWPLLYFPKSFFCWNVSAIKTVLSCFSFRSLGKGRVRASFIWVFNWFIWNTEQHDTKTDPSFLFGCHYSEWKPLWNMAKVNIKYIKEVDQNIFVLSWFLLFIEKKQQQHFECIVDIFLNDAQ